MVRLTGENGNASTSWGSSPAALREAGVPQKEIARYMKESMACDYDDLLVIALKWVDVR